MPLIFATPSIDFTPDDERDSTIASACHDDAARRDVERAFPAASAHADYHTLVLMRVR